MPAFRPALFSLFLATSLAAQTPARPSPSNPQAVVAPRQSVSLDVAALVDDRARVGLEPLVFGRWTIGLGASFTRTAPEEAFSYPVPLRRFGQRDVVAETGGPTTIIIQRPPCIEGDQCFLPPITDERPKYRAWSLDLSARYYPAAFSFSNPRQRLMLYVGEFIGYHKRRVEQTIVYYYGCPYCATPLARDTLYPPPPDTSYVPPPIYIPPSLSRFTQNLHGWEPGAEIGARLIPASPVFIDVGAWFKFVTVNDPMQRIRPGDVDSRLVVAVGIGW